MKFLIIFFLIAGLGYCSHPKAADNTVIIDQVGSNNQYIITQDYTGNSINISVGKDSASDNNVIGITQGGFGQQTSNIKIPSGINNTVTVTQNGVGNMVATVDNMNGSANNITINQSGASNNTMNIIGGTGTTNNANTINATQSGNAGADKTFTLNMNGTNGANVTVQQTNPNQSNSGSMSIQCYTNCGSYSYIRN